MIRLLAGKLGLPLCLLPGEVAMRPALRMEGRLPGRERRDEILDGGQLPMSRAVVMPLEASCLRDSSESRWTWASMKPGSRTPFLQSMT